MPFQLSTNRLLSWGMGLFCLYWVTGYTFESLWYSVLISACLLVGSIMVAGRAVPDAISIVKQDQIGPGELAVIALALLSIGGIWSGVFNITYSYYGRPHEWIGPVSSFGRAMIAVALFVLFLSPDATRQGIKWPHWYILLGAAVFIATLAFLLGYMIKSSDPQALSDILSSVPRQMELMYFRTA